mmetsp:Transcript_143/g.382  ORF Transcript_143/g.382 Transcript_143/m.382 type:complete len:466 (-) Transcript_143:90-1487(-)
MTCVRPLLLGLLLGDAAAVRMAGVAAPSWPSRTPTAAWATGIHSLAAHPWPAKNGNFQRSGQGQGVKGPTDLSKPAWVFEAEGPASKDVFYAAPVIDFHGNAHFSDMNGVHFCMSPSGKLKWRVTLPKENRYWGQLPTPVLFGNAVYTVDGQGSLVALSLDSGEELLRRRYAFTSGGDEWSMGFDAPTQTVLAIGSPTQLEGDACPYGGSHLFALDARDGHTKWAYKLRECTCNLMPAAASGQVLFSDATGITYALDVLTGKELWIQPGYGHQTFTTAGAAVSGTGLVVMAANRHASSGAVRAFEARTGKIRWERFFKREANNAPAIYKDRYGRELVVMGITNNPGFPDPTRNGKASWNGTVFALDTNTGHNVWLFSPPEWKNPASAGSTSEQICLPDGFTNPSVDSSGTVFIGWMGGAVFAIDGTTGKELSSWRIGSGMQGAPAVGKNMLVVSSCKRMAGFVGM